MKTGYNSSTNGPLRSLQVLLALLCFLRPATMHAQEQTVAMEITSFSPQVSVARGTDPNGFEYEVQFTTAFTGEINGELALGGFDFDLWSILVLETEFDADLIFLDFEIDLPPFSDSNQNAVHDFYDESMAVNNAAVQGYYINPLTDRPAAVNGVWNRPAGSLSGQLQLSFSGLNFTTVHNFILYSYRGDFTFTRSAQDLSGTVALTNIYDPSEVTSGPLALTIQDPLTLVWDAGTWESSYFFTYQYDPEGDPFEHFASQYVSFFSMTDGYLWTGAEDFNFWFAFLDGTDSDGDGTPDLAEGGAPPVTRPSLGAVRVPGGIQITITGTAGASYSLEGAAAVDGTWNNLQTVTLTSATQTVTLPTGSPQQFLRLRAL